MFKILVYAYINCIDSSRKIEKAYKRDINFMWLLCTEKVKTLVEKINKEYDKSFLVNDEKLEVCLLKEILEFLNLRENEERIQFVYGK